MSTNNKKECSRKQEKLIANLLDWNVVSGSGARNLYPGDIQSDEWLGECKTHTTPGHKIVFFKTVWEKIVDEAIAKHRFPALFVDDGSQAISNTWVMYNTLPGVEYVMSNRLQSANDNIRFDSLDMMRHKKDLGVMLPVIYEIKRPQDTVYVSTLEEFSLMFATV